MILRLSQKLATKIKAGMLGEMPLDENPFADWSCHLFTANRTQYIIMSNTPSMYSCVMYGKGITYESIFIQRALSTIREFMEDDGQSAIFQRLIAPASGEVGFAKALNRSVTGSTNELVMSAKAQLNSGEISPHSIGFKLNDFLLSALASKGKRSYGKPKEAFELLTDRYWE
jgi:hypothetical protein